MPGASIEDPCPASPPHYVLSRLLIGARIWHELRPRLPQDERLMLLRGCLPIWTGLCHSFHLIDPPSPLPWCWTCHIGSASFPSFQTFRSVNLHRPSRLLT